MNSRLFLFVVLFACSPSPTGSTRAALVQGPPLVIVAGQSNVLPRSNVADPGGEAYAGSGTALSWRYLEQSNGTVTYDSNAWELMLTTAGGAFGVERPLGDATRRDVIAVGIGATKLSRDWLPGLWAHSRLVAEVDAALVVDGRPIGWVVWWQGENDANDPAAAAAYQSNLQVLVSDLRARWGTFRLIVVFIHVDCGRPYASQVRAAQEAYVANDPLAFGVDPDLYPNEGAHYPTASTVEIGIDCAAVMDQGCL